MALLTEIHYLFIQSPWILGERLLQLLARPSEVILVWFSVCCWKVVTVSPPPPDDSADLRLR